MFNIYTNDIFFIPDNACLNNYADDTTLYSIVENQSTYRNISNLRKYYYMNFGSSPDSSDFILKDSTKIPSAEEHIGSYDRQ